MPLWVSFLLFAGISARGADLAALLIGARAAEARFDAEEALPLYLAALQLDPNDPVILQKVARQYSDLADAKPSLPEKRRCVQTALDYARRASALDPGSAVDELSLAICHGKLASWSDIREKIAYSRLVGEEAEKALALDPNYAWAHDVLGRWHSSLASLSGSQRFFVRLFYGSLPPASADQAIAHLRRAVALEPDEPAHRVELGFAYLSAGRRHDARMEWTRALALPARAGFDREEKARARTALAEWAEAPPASKS